MWLSVCSALRTLITGMASGSIVAFNIDFNRWHYEHQNRYWGGQRDREENGKRREEQEGEEVMHSAVYLQRGETKGTETREKQVLDLRLYSFVKFTWVVDAAAPVEITSSVHTCTYTHVCNHRPIIPRRYIPKPAHKIDRLQNGGEEQVKQTL